jgi:hypothetical protein
MFRHTAHRAIRVPVVFRLRNLSPSLEVSFLLELDTRPPSSSSSSSSPAPATPWTGVLTRRGTLSPLQTLDLETAMWVTQPGPFDAGRWSLATPVSIRRGEERYVQVTPQQRFARVESVVEGENLLSTS